ncbi:hypothetical protein Pelo_8188 [Pelomyxa schiedti]|nr:hypothetical protein Pelo_8188 [Pelomyxa schiedti]
MVTKLRPANDANYNEYGDQEIPLVDLKIDSGVMYKYHRYTMRFSVDGMWRQTSGLSNTQLVNHVLRGHWIKYGTSPSQKALCTKCNALGGGAPVDLTLWNLPESSAGFGSLAHSKEVFTFRLHPKCSSSRSHIKSKLAFLVTSLPGVGTFCSNPVSLCSRDRHIEKYTSTKSSSLPLVPKPPSLYLHATNYSTEHIVKNTFNLLRHSNSLASALVTLDTSSSRQFIVDSRIVPILPESTIAAIPERVFRRPTIVVLLMRITEENFNIMFTEMGTYQSPLDFVLQHRKLSDNLYIITMKHQSVENFCYCNEALARFARGKNPFHIDLTKPNPIVTFIGWANNTFSQT